ncbi:amino acid ABC transporter substrate-binding protein, partial [Butyricicoccus sp. 1XD8-22]
MNFKQLGKLFALSFATVSILAACGNNETATENEQPEKVQETQDVTKIKVAFAQAAKPITYVDENGNPAGYDVEAMMLVDEALEDYEFEFVPTTDEDLFIGVEQG